jgi:thioredoxin 1
MNPTFEVTEQDFGEQVLKSSMPVLVEFTADWCPPCKVLAPIVHQIAHKYEGNLRVGVMDSDANPQTILQYGVMGLPTLILFVDGQPVERIVGFKPLERIEAKLLPHLTIEKA